MRVAGLRAWEGSSPGGLGAGPPPGGRDMPRGQGARRFRLRRPGPPSPTPPHPTPHPHPERKEKYRSAEMRGRRTQRAPLHPLSLPPPVSAGAVRAGVCARGHGGGGAGDLPRHDRARHPAAGAPLRPPACHRRALLPATAAPFCLPRPPPLPRCPTRRITLHAAQELYIPPANALPASLSIPPSSVTLACV